MPGELPVGAPDVLRSIAFSLVSLLNLRLGDFLTPSAPLQVSRVVQNGRQFSNAVSVAVENRKQLSVEAVEDVLREFFDAVLRRSESGKLQTALELYGSHFFERGQKTRFLLLVMAIEALTTPIVKHPAALRLLDKWQTELAAEKSEFAESTPEFAAFGALERELLFRREDSIRSQVRHLMARASAFDLSGRGDLPGRVIRVYDQRSALVHDGALPTAELVGLEAEARELLEVALRFLLSEAIKADSAG
jgi:hypothetical protein